MFNELDVELIENILNEIEDDEVLLEEEEESKTKKNNKPKTKRKSTKKKKKEIVPQIDPNLDLTDIDTF